MKISVLVIGFWMLCLRSAANALAVEPDATVYVELRIVELDVKGLESLGIDKAREFAAGANQHQWQGEPQELAEFIDALVRNQMATRLFRYRLSAESGRTVTFKTETPHGSTRLQLKPLVLGDSEISVEHEIEFSQSVAAARRSHLQRGRMKLSLGRAACLGGESGSTTVGDAQPVLHHIIFALSADTKRADANSRAEPVPLRKQALEGRDFSIAK